MEIVFVVAIAENGVIGAGNFARAVLLPGLKAIPGVRFKTLVTTRGATAEHGAQQQDFENAATDDAAVFDDPDINTVIIATRHDSHAGLAGQLPGNVQRLLTQRASGVGQVNLDAALVGDEASPLDKAQSLESFEQWRERAGVEIECGTDLTDTAAVLLPQDQQNQVLRVRDAEAFEHRAIHRGGSP